MLSALTKASRWAKVKDCRVEWCNLIGVYCGQSGHYTFNTTEDAQVFASFISTGFPSISREELGSNGIPTPLEMD